MTLNLKSYGTGLGILLAGIVAYFVVNGNPLNDYQLMANGTTVEGTATDVNDFEDREDNGNVTRYFFIKYEFTTSAGEKIADVVEVPGTSSDKGYHTGQSLDIQYLPNAPHIHRVKALASTTLTGWLTKNILFGMLAIAPGCYFLFRAWQQERMRQAK